MYPNGIKDSGNRREFETGAVRDITEGKGRCDLLPLDVVNELLTELVDVRVTAFLKNMYEFISTGDIACVYDAFLCFCHERAWGVYTAVLEVSVHYENGAKKYGERNWEHGIPSHSYVDSAVRHYLKWCRGDDDEPHDRAVIWNLLGLLWTLKHKPELDDINRSVFVK